MDDLGLMLLLKKIARDRGLDFSGYKASSLERRILSRLHALRVNSLHEYLKKLDQIPGEYNRLIKNMTINVTEFFRDRKMFNILERQVIPEIVQRKLAKDSRIIRVWSAGTAYGAEAYSLAMLFHENIDPLTSEFLIKIYGSDIDNDCIARAAKAEYSLDEVKNLRRHYIVNYFKCVGNKYVIVDSMRRMVKFIQHDLINDNPLINMDLILCRNVMIYFTKELQQKIFIKFYNALNNLGYLILGVVESLSGKVQQRFRVIDNETRIYQKI